MEMNSPEKCLLCSRSNYDIVFSYDTPDRYEESIGITAEGYFRRWVKCTECGFFFTTHSRQKGAIEKIYAGDYRRKGTPWREESAEEVFERITQLPESESESKARVRWIKENIRDLQKSHIISTSIPPWNLLDIGGGAGVFAHAFQDEQWRASVVDPSGESFLNEKYHIPLRKEFYRPNIFDRKFDLISLVYVLEHLTDPVPLIENLRCDLEPGGYMYIEVPDELSFMHRPPEDDIFNSCHLWMFGPKSITTFLNSRGYQVQSLHRKKTVRGHYALMVLSSCIEANPI